MVFLIVPTFSVSLYIPMVAFSNLDQSSFKMLINPVLEVFSGTCGSLQSIGCSYFSMKEVYYSVDADLTNLTPGATYYYRAYGSSSNNVRTNIITYITTPPAAVVNDECSGALAVTPSPNANPGTSVVSSNVGATESMSECFGTVQNDIWFKFTATSTRHNIYVSMNNNSPWLEVFSGTCGSLQNIGCWGISTNGASDFVVAEYENLTRGATYYYRTYNPFNSTGTSITTYVTTPPDVAANDECSGAIALSVNADNSCTNVYNGNIGFSSQSRPPCVPSGNNSARDVWFKFIATSTSHRITVAPIGFNDYVFEVFSGTCNSLTSLACVNTGSLSEPDIAVLNNLVAGNTYYMRVYDYNGGSSIDKQFNICISTTTSILDNDECSGALAVTPSSNTSSSPDVVSHNFGATQSMAGCFGTAEDDVWFKFTATSTRHRVSIVSAKKINPVLEVFSGTCGSLQSISCRYVNTNELYYYVDADLTNLTPGTTYYYRTYGSSSSNIRTSITTYVTTPSATVLPVTMAGFTVKSDMGKNVLRWHTLSETNNSGFEIQYSRDGIYFDSLYFVASHVNEANSSVHQSYMYEHDVTRVAAGKVYYRLKQTDYDLHDHYSNVISAEIVSKQNISILPNPVGHYIYVRMPQTKGYQFVISDYVGRIYQQGALQNNEIKVPELKSGMYILRLINDNGAVVVLKFLKL